MHKVRDKFQAFNKYIHNALFCAKDHQKEEFDLDEAVSDFCNLITQKIITQQCILL